MGGDRLDKLDKFEKFTPLDVSSKFAICGLPIRADTYKTCSFGCKYCFSNNRVICEFEKNLQVGNIDFVRKKMEKIKAGQVKSFLDALIKEGYTWHCGGMSDPFQPVEEKLGVTGKLIDVGNEYGVSMLFSTKSDNVYGANIRPDLHSFQLSVTNTGGEIGKKLEPGVADIGKRLEFYKELKKEGFKVGVRIQPFIPDVSTLEIVKMFEDADMFTLEGIKLVPQNKEHKEEVLRLCGLKQEDFTQMGLLNLKPEIRAEKYKEFVEYFESKGIPYSLADNDMHYMGNNKCCCGDRLVKKSSDFNTTALFHKYGLEYGLEDVKSECEKCGVWECKCNQLFTSNRQEGCKTVGEFFEKRFDRKSSPFSPKFEWWGDEDMEWVKVRDMCRENWEKNEKEKGTNENGRE